MFSKRKQITELKLLHVLKGNVTIYNYLNLEFVTKNCFCFKLAAKMLTYTITDELCIYCQYSVIYICWES